MTDSIDRFYAEWAAQIPGPGAPPADAGHLYRIMRIARLLGDRLDATCARHGLTRSQFEALAALRRRRPEPLSAQDLMDASFLTSGSVTAMINQLAANGLVRRRQHREDRRRLQISLTPRGTKVIEAAIAERAADNAALAAALPANRRQRLDKLLGECLGNLEYQATEAGR